MAKLKDTIYYTVQGVEFEGNQLIVTVKRRKWFAWYLAIKHILTGKHE